MPNNIGQHYGPEFYEHQAGRSEQSAQHVVPMLIDYLHPESVVDVGCGVGTWLKVFKDCGVSQILGVDGAWVERNNLRIPAECFVEMDLAKPFQLPRSFDVALSLEVAEHLPAAAASDFVHSLTTFAPVVVFSAAIPRQGGVNHLNEQWPDYWAGLFQKEGYQVIDCIRPRIWDNSQVQYWYAQNVLLFVRTDCVGRFPRLSEAAPTRAPLRIVHPASYAQLAALCDEANARADASEAAPLRELFRALAKRFWSGDRREAR